MKSGFCGALLCAIAVGAHAQEVKPGLWEDKASYTLNGKPLVLSDEHGRPISTFVSKGCLASADAGNVRAVMERNMLKDMPGCHLTRWDYAPGTLKVRVSCDATARSGPGTLEGSGPVTADRHDVSGTGHSQNPQLGPVTVGFRDQGRHLGACKS